MNGKRVPSSPEHVTCFHFVITIPGYCPYKKDTGSFSTYTFFRPKVSMQSRLQSRKKVAKWQNEWKWFAYIRWWVLTVRFREKFWKIWVSKDTVICQRKRPPLGDIDVILPRYLKENWRSSTVFKQIFSSSTLFWLFWYLKGVSIFFRWFIKFICSLSALILFPHWINSTPSILSLIYLFFCSRQIYVGCMFAQLSANKNCLRRKCLLLNLDTFLHRNRTTRHFL